MKGTEATTLSTKCSTNAHTMKSERKVRSESSKFPTIYKMAHVNSE